MNYNGLLERTEGFTPHTYFLGKDGKCWGYTKAGASGIERFNKPLSFSKSYRKFEKVVITERDDE